MEKITVTNEILDLIRRIHTFLDEYANISPNYGGDIDEKYTSPDAFQLLGVAQILKMGYKPKRCFSEYYISGGYKRSDEGKAIHDQLLTEIYQIINE